MHTSFIITVVLLAGSLYGQTQAPASNKFIAPKGGITNISFVGNGDIQKSLSENADIQANTGLGVVFFRLWEDSSDRKRSLLVQSIQFDFVVNVASTSDTIVGNYNNNILRNQRDFGSYILNPINSRQATYFDFSAYTNNNIPWGKEGKFNFFRNVLSGVNVRFIASNSVWQGQTASVNLAGFMFRAGIFHDFIPDHVRIRKDYSATIGVSYTYRGILGDIRSSQYEDFRKQMIVSDRVRYNGYELNLALKLRNIRAEVQIPALNYKNAEVIGLTGTQFITSIRFVGGFPLKMDGDRNDENQPGRQ